MDKTGRLRWNCEVQGCFNRIKRPKWELFSDCFSRGSRFGDLDAVIDNNGERFLFVDWKCHGKAEIDNGQRYLFKALARLPSVTVLVICGDAETTTDISAMRVIADGQIGELRPIDFAGVQAWLRIWWRNGLPERERNDYDLKQRNISAVP